MILDKIKSYISEKTLSSKDFAKYTGNTKDESAVVIGNVFPSILQKGAITTALSQLQKAIKETSGGLMGIMSNVKPTDLQEWLNQVKTVYAFDTNTQGERVITKFSDVVKLCNLASMSKEITKGGRPIGIVKAKFNDEDIYMVTLCGTGFSEGQANGIISDILSGTEQNSTYLTSAIEAVNTLPAGSKIFICGFSLGGMLAQQLMVQPSIYNNYEIVGVMAGAAPALNVDERTDEFKRRVSIDKIRRVIAYYDLVPYLCIDYFTKADYLDGHIPKAGTVYESLYIDYTKNYNTGFLGQHTIGYMKDSLWDKIDVAGVENGNNVIKFKLEDMDFFASPSIFTPNVKGEISSDKQLMKVKIGNLLSLIN